MNSRVTVKRIGLGMFCVALLIRFYYLFEQSMHAVSFGIPMYDEAEMLSVANRLGSGEGFGSTPLFKAPLYPLLISLFIELFGDSWIFMIRLFQHSCGAALVGIGAWLAGRLAGTGRVSLWAAGITGGLLAVYGPLIRLEHRLVLDFMAVFFQSILLFVLIKPPFKMQGLCAGVVAGLAILNRPTLLPVLPFIALWLVWRNRSIKSALTFLLPVVLCLMGMGQRNLNAGGEWMVMPWQGGYNFYEANRIGASGRYLSVSQTSFSDVDNPTIDFAKQPYLASNNLQKVDSYKKLNQFWYQKAKEEIFEQPDAWLLLMIKKGFYLISEREIFNFEDYRVQRSLSPSLKLMVGSFGIIWPLALAGLLGGLGMSPAQKKNYILLWIYVLLLGGCIALFYCSGRMRMPIAWPIAILAGVSLAQFLSKVFASKLRIGWLVLCTLGILSSWGNWWGVRSEDTSGMEYLKLSSAAWKASAVGPALAFAEKAEETIPHHPTLPQLKAQALYELDRIDEAEEEFIRSMEFLPRDPVAPYNLACLSLYKQRDLRKALHYTEQALKRASRYNKADLLRIRLLKCLGESVLAGEAFVSLTQTLRAEHLDTYLDWKVTEYLMVNTAEEKARVKRDIQKHFGSFGVEKLHYEMSFCPSN